MKELLGGLALLVACALLYLGGLNLFSVLDSMDVLAPKTIGLLAVIGVGIFGLAVPSAVVLMLVGFARLVWIPMPKQECADQNGSNGPDA